jgi:ABC-type molybdenum transport system ATPase subunit/photorepair protein PhrA
MITGDHPQSYTQSHLHLFGRPRKNLATVRLQRKVGISSPEIFAAFPRRLGPGALTARDAIATGFDGTYAYRKRTEQEEKRLNEIIGALGSGKNEDARIKWAETPFAILAPGEQSLVLLMRALVASPPLAILDEAFAGMDDATILRCSEYLRLWLGAHQAVIMVSHWDDEIPWKGDDLRRYLIEDGVGGEI